MNVTTVSMVEEFFRSGMPLVSKVLTIAVTACQSGQL